MTIVAMDINPLFFEESSTIEMPLLEDIITDAKYLSKAVLVCRFNGLWTRLEDLHSFCYLICISMIFHLHLYISLMHKL